MTWVWHDDHGRDRGSNKFTSLLRISGAVGRDAGESAATNQVNDLDTRRTQLVE